ncbi:hypothetical protein [Aliidiomarina quisquiliarum]|uniref:hypothetical protein n=1 Tax=Aliidiomarina quisquiliarum TaxID=2938947 RepID=UPI00208E3DB3|nr:hypothetical protein [Aliidiomarina quisquiliarum]MCO4321137.1 hypothetical protein [Aliidiomarina quisquiliarum]
MRKFIIASVTALATLTGTFILAAPNQKNCTDVFNGVQHTLCGASNIDTPVTWRAWLQGSSRSTQFHFLDLVELMFGDKVKDTAKKTTKSDKSSFLSFSYD